MSAPVAGGRRWAFVAGGSGGIGAAICRALAEDGWDVALSYHRNAEAAKSAAAGVREHGGQARIVQLDLTDTGQTAAAVQDLPGPLGGVVYAAGPVIPMRYISALPPGMFRDQILGDAVACYNLLQPSIAPLRASRGAIVAVSTAAVLRFPKKDLLSAAPKAAVQQIVRGIAVEEGRNGIRANCVGAGLVEGDGMWQQLVRNGDYTEELVTTARRNLALRRFGTVSDIAEAVRFLISERARWITGQTLNVDGGFAL